MDNQTLHTTSQSARRKGVALGALILEISYGISTLAIFALQMLVARALRGDDYGVFSVLFSATVVISALIGNPLELVASTRVAEFISKRLHCKHLFRQIALWLLVATTLLLVVMALLRPMLVRNLFPEYPSAYYIMVIASILTSSNMCLMGILRGAREFVTYSVVMLCDAVLKIIMVLLLLYGRDGGVNSAIAALAIAAALSVPITLGGILFHRSLFEGESTPEATPTSGSTLRLLLPVVALLGLGAYLNNTGPILIKWMGSSSSNELAGYFLIALMFTRLLPMISRALGMSLLPNFVTFCVNREWHQVRRYFWLSYRLFAALSVLAVAGAHLFGLDIIRVFYPTFSFPRAGLTFLTAGSALLAFALINNQLFVSTSQAHKAIFSWAIGCAIWTGIPLFLEGDILIRISTGFLLGCAAIFLIQVFLVAGILRKEPE
jgi:O-antigen/teichoic acid export membrane protein